MRTDVDDFLVYWDTYARLLSIQRTALTAAAAELERAAAVYPLATLRAAARRVGALTVGRTRASAIRALLDYTR